MSLIKPKTPVIFLAFANERSDRGFLRKLTIELKSVMRALEQAVQNGRCQLRILPAATQSELTEVFQDPWYDGRIWIFHYGGHADEDELWLETAEGANKSFFSIGLARFLGAQKGLKLVFLNGCATEAHARMLLDAQIPAVIATSSKIDDAQATQFANIFYKGLASGASIEEAFKEAEGVLLGEYGDAPFKPQAGTRSLFWEDAPEAQPGTLDLPWRLHLREDTAWMSSQWRLFYELKESSGEQPVDAEAFVGQTLNNYQILEFLGQGALGHVYRAVHTSLNEERAIKIMHPIIEGYELFRSIMIAGNRGLASIQHPNVVEFYDAGEIDLFGEKRLYIVMELVKGKRMDEFDFEAMLEDPAQLKELKRMAIEVATGLEAAHKTRYFDENGIERQGIVHGNIKMRKIMFTPEGIPKLIDFMFADVTRSRNIKMLLPEEVKLKSRAERPEDLFPPEVIRGDTPVNKQTDIFALGAVFFEIATDGEKIADFAFGSADEMHRYIRNKHGQFPRYLSQVIFLATHPDPRTRYQEVGMMIEGMLNNTGFWDRIRYRMRRKSALSVRIPGMKRA